MYRSKIKIKAYISLFLGVDSYMGVHASFIEYLCNKVSKSKELEEIQTW